MGVLPEVGVCQRHQTSMACQFVSNYQCLEVKVAFGPQHERQPASDRLRLSSEAKFVENPPLLFPVPRFLRALCLPSIRCARPAATPGHCFLACGPGRCEGAKA